MKKIAKIKNLENENGESHIKHRTSQNMRKRSQRFYQPAGSYRVKFSHKRSPMGVKVTRVLDACSLCGTIPQRTQSWLKRRGRSEGVNGPKPSANPILPSPHLK